METTMMLLSRGFIGMMEKRMETTNHHKGGI